MNSSHFQSTWTEFKRSLLRSRDPFNPFAWIYRLVFAALQDVCEWTGIAKIPWRPCIPVGAMCLMVFITASYFWKFRVGVVQERWCDSSAAFCVWLPLQDIVVSYLCAMSLFHFSLASTTSPGVSSTEKSNGATVTMSLVSDQELMKLYGTIGVEEMSATCLIPYHPSQHASFCDRCEKHRPPRCHHCRQCKSCILQFDHHCIWLNNCVGLYNIRSFLLTLIYVTIGCWYGVLLLYRPFYDPLQDMLRPYGGIAQYVQMYAANNVTDNKTIFQFPSGSEVLGIVFGGSPFPVQTLVDIVFPLLLGMGAVLSAFLGTHLKFVITARTTLEHRMALDRKCKALLGGRTESFHVNPFDHGSYYKNWTQTMGSSWLNLLLPVRVDLSPPFNSMKKDQ